MRWVSLVLGTLIAVMMIVTPTAAGKTGLSWKDPATGNIWHFLSQSIAWHEAVEGCRTFANAPSRLPSLDEWWEAYDRFKDSDLARSLQVLQLKAWSADQFPDTDPLLVWALFLQSGNGGGIRATELAAAACVSP